MAVIQNPIIGRAKQKFANAVFSTWVGQNVLRSKPLTVANPQTPLQIRNRNRITFLAQTAKAYRTIIDAVFGRGRVAQTTYNVFASLNYQNFTDAIGSPNATSFVLSGLKVSRQNLEIQGLTITGSNDTITVNNPAFEPGKYRIWAGFYTVASGNPRADEVELVVEAASFTNVTTINGPTGSEQAIVVVFEVETGRSLQQVLAV